jgi:small subunit ribosomal protein S29
VSLPGPVVDSLRAAGAFKKNQGWGLFRKPSVLMRREAVDLAKLVMEAEGKDAGSAAERRLFTGEKASGKSTLLLQAMAMAFTRGWVVINFPEGMDFFSAAGLRS